jgi:DNA-binding CsgD family transcriptional regulator
MRRHDHTTILGLVDKLYAAALGEAAWGDFLSSAAEAVEADHAFVCELNFQERSLDYLGLKQVNRAAMPVRRYGNLLEDDPRRAIFDARPNQASHCRMGLSQERLHSSRTYRNYLRPLNIEYTMVACMPVRDGVSQDIGFTRTRARSVFRKDDCDLVNELIPHLRRALVIGERATPVKPRPADCDPLALQSRLALSPAQARVAALLFEGRNIKDAARELQLTEGSARQYLQKIFEKTGARRQLDLIRIIEGALARND